MSQPVPQTKIILSGASGLIGRALTAHFQNAHPNIKIIPLIRGPAPSPTGIAWNPLADSLDPAPFEGASAIIHLAGKNLASGRWNQKQKQEFRDSRVKSTSVLAQTLATLKQKPQTFLCASGIGFYGDRGQEPVDENSPPGKGIVADWCKDWETACAPAAKAGIRVVNVRFGVVLSRDGGALAAMAPMFRLGLGAVLGTGRQYVSWITLSDAIAAMDHLLHRSQLAGPVNLVTPNAVTFRQFATALGNALHRPVFLRIPSPMAKVFFGEIAKEVLLGGANVYPRQLVNEGFQFTHPHLQSALRAIYC